MELLAQILEVISVFAADMRLKKPLTVPRPGTVSNPSTGGARKVMTAEGYWVAEDSYDKVFAMFGATQPGAA